MLIPMLGSNNLQSKILNL